MSVRYREMIAYLLLTNISRMFSSMPGLAGGIAREIREGTMKRYLIQPIDMIGYLLVYRVAHKVTYIVMSFIPYALLFFLCRGFFDGFPDALTLAAFAVSLVLSFLVGFLLRGERRDGGLLVPRGHLALVHRHDPELLHLGAHAAARLASRAVGRLARSALPFQYMAYFPAVVFLGKVKGPTLLLHLLGELFWAVFFMVLARVLYRLGLRRYSAFGG